MEQDQLITIETFCTCYEVEHSFLDLLLDNGLIETVVVQDTRFIHPTELHRAERIVRLHNELEINLEGIEAIHTLLGRIDHMDREIVALRNKLRFYEGP